MTEIWRDAVGWEGFYAVSNMGRVKRLAGSPRCPSDRILRQRKTERGYCIVSPVRSGHKQQAVVVHHLVLHAFVGPPPTPRHVPNHKNGKKSDNRLDNLEWITHAENIKHAYDNGLHGRYVGSKASAAKLTESEVSQILARIAARGYRRDIAKDFGISTKMIDEIVAGNHWTHVPRPNLSMKRMGRQVLTEGDVRRIRSILRSGTRSHGDIAAEFGVSGPTIWQIAAGRTWKHVS